MKAVLEFTLPDENLQHQMALNGARYLSALREIDEYLRSRIKYPPSVQSQQTRGAFEDVRRVLREAVPDLDND